MKKNIKNYSIGLDIGTNSVGWAVTDESGELLKYNSKRHMWGARLFKEAESAAKRRGFRSTSRRMERRKERIRLLQDLLKDDIIKTDKNFYDNLEFSKYHNGDVIKVKNNTIKRDYKYNMFNDEDFTDKTLYKKYNTIYHLRKKLVESDEKEDIRLVYLAIHHIIKYRGNFLYSGKFNVGDTKDIRPKLEQILEYAINHLSFDDIEFDKIFEILKIENMYKKQKQEKLLSLFNVDDIEKKKIKSIFGLIIGKKEELSNIFDMSEKKSLRLTDNYDEDEICNLLGENYEIFVNIKYINSWYTLQYILQDSTYISESFVKKYEKYKQDLKKLKEIYIKYLPLRYKEMFKSNNEKLSNYYNYNRKNVSWEIFMKEVKKDLSSINENNDINLVLKDIENESFLSRLNITDNGAIPYQLHKIELEKILSNQEKFYKTIKENKEKILKILEFRIPYYVGPLHNDPNQPNNWSIRFSGKEHEKVYPWNFEKIIDRDASANEFIKRMTSKCTYLPEEDVIPKNSLLYCEYCVLNELNSIRYNEGKQLSIDEKSKIINELFKKKVTVSKEKLKEFLEREDQLKIREITGFQKEDEFASNMKPYIDFKKIFGKVDDSNKEIIEEIIEWITIFEDKEILQRKLKKYSNIIDEEKANLICKLNYSGWSRLSKKLLVEIKYKNDYEQKYSIMDLLRTTNYNFMQIITDKTYGFDKVIKENQKNIESKKIDYNFYNDNIANLAGSPALKRGIWQTLKVVNEIVKIMGREPDNIFVEFARNEDEKKRTSSKNSKLLKSYLKFCEKNSNDINKELLTNLKNKKLDLTDRLYLYCTQNGKCMYSGKSLDIDSLELYQVDHIIPQSKIKDDSIDNKVLVYSKYNQRKLDGLIEDKIILSQKENWRKLFECGLISNVKYFNLINNHETPKKIEGFIKRQLVETRQIIKSVTNILENLYEESNVFAIKAQLGNDFREKYDIYKIRGLNDYHHAQDALISIIIGSYVNKKYPKMLKEFIYKDYIKEYKKATEDNNDKKKKYGFIISNIGKEYIDSTTGEIIDDNNAKKEIEKLLKQFDIKDIFITKKLEEKTGKFYKETIYSVKDGKKNISNPIPLKKYLTDCSKYGAYNGEVCAYSVFFSYINKKGNIEYQITGVPIVKELNIKSGILKLEDYISQKYNVESVKIIKSKILANQLICKDGVHYYIVSANEIKIARELRLNKSHQLLLYVLLNDDAKLKNYIKAYNELKKIDLKEREYDEFIEKIKENKESYEKEEYFKKKMQIKEYVKNEASVVIYDVLTEKIMKCYFKDIGKNLVTYKEKYLELDLTQKCEIIKLLLSLTNGNSIDLKLIGGKSSQGRISNKNMNNAWLKGVTFVYQSVTGMYEKRFKLDELENSDSI